LGGLHFLANLGIGMFMTSHLSGEKLSMVDVPVIPDRVKSINRRIAVQAGLVKK
jgi:hypothetical protein